MERAERMLFVGVGLMFSRLLVPILWVMLALTLVTAGQRFVMVWRQGSAPRRPAGDRLPLRDRWRGWRPGEGFELRRRETRPRWRERTRLPRRG
jgi:CDP-diacylglycerol--glycerol-3-phosphate 3-phosphatidyltransferase